MKNIRYALASVSYHKKISFGIGLCSTFFLFLLTSILNLIDIEKSLYEQMGQLITNPEYHLNYQKVMRLYSSSYILFLFVWMIMITILILVSFKIKKQDMLKWRIMGFSNRFVIKQTIIENLIPIIAGILTAAVFFIVCQHTYEFLLTQIRPLIAQARGINRIVFSSSNVLIESTPNQVVNTTSDAQFLTMRINLLPVTSVFRAFSRNCFLFVSITTGITLIATVFLSKNSKKVF